MTTYYNKPLEGVVSAIFDVNPALYTGIASKVGRFPLEVADPWKMDTFHFNGVLKQLKMRFADEPGWDAIPSAIPEPGIVKAKWFYWNDEISEIDYKSLQTNPNGHTAQTIRSRLQGQQDYFVSQVDHYLLGFLYADTDADYDAQWRPLMANKAAGTISDPEDINATPGTTTATGIKFTGAGQVSDAYNKAIGKIKQRFLQQYDSDTKQAMYKKQNTFDIWMHPSVKEILEDGHEINSNGYYDYSKSYADIIQKKGVTIEPTFAIDAAYDAANGTVAEIGMSMNTAENFMINEILPYTVEPYIYNPSTRKYEMRAYWKILPMVKPYKIGDSWKKAFTSFSIIPYAES